MSETVSVGIPDRGSIPVEHTWNLEKLFRSEQAWEEALVEYERQIPGIDRFKGTLGRSAENLRECLDYMMRLERDGERLGYYAHLRVSEDTGSSEHQARFARYVRLASLAEAAASYQAPEIQAIPDETMARFLENPTLAEYRIYLDKLLRFKPHILSEQEERLLALQEEANQTSDKAFSALTNVDLDFGVIETPEGNKPLSNSTFAVFMLDPRREIREKAYMQFYREFEKHRNTLAALYEGSVLLDKYRAEIRRFPSARAARLFPDKVPEAVYDTLVNEVTAGLPALHDYYELKRRTLGLDQLRLYDTKVSLVPDIEVKIPYEEAVKKVISALAPLGEEYVSTLAAGLFGRWVDRYENKGKRSGAFSAGSYLGDPYILMNYKEDDIRDLFTLAHEGGHSMHSWYSVRNNPFQHYRYTIFEAEVASTFNEQLLFRYLIDHAESDQMRLYLVNKRVDDIIGTLYRQTMFAEYEKITHEMVERGIPLTVDSLRSEYRKLLYKYFGPNVAIDSISDLEGLRIPHFYSAFYVYKYATGISAAIALAERVLSGEPSAREKYFAFLKSGGSKYPLESLAEAGVDMSRPEPIRTALGVFAELVRELSDGLSR